MVTGAKVTQRGHVRHTHSHTHSTSYTHIVHTCTLTITHTLPQDAPAQEQLQQRADNLQDSVCPCPCAVYAVCAKGGVASAGAPGGRPRRPSFLHIALPRLTCLSPKSI